METQINTERWRLNLLLVAIFLLAVISFWQGQNKQIGIVQSASTVQAAPEEQIVPPASDINLSLPHLKDGAAAQPALENFTARAYLVYDIESGKLLVEKNLEEPLPIASLTKLTTALAVSRNLSPETVITVGGQGLSSVPTPKLNLVEGEKITVASLVEGMLVASANDAAIVLGQALGEGSQEKGIELMNILAASLGTENTNYANTTGFDDPTGHSTARDLLPIILEVYRNPWLMSVLGQTSGSVRSIDGRYVHYFRTTNTLLRNFDENVWAGKTGFTDNARGNLIVFAKNPVKGDLVAVVIGSENREQDMQELLTWVFNNFEW